MNHFNRLVVRQSPLYAFALAALVALLLGACIGGNAPDPASVPTGPASETEMPAESVVPTPTTAPDAVEEPATLTVAVSLDQLELDLQPVVQQLQDPLFVTHVADGSGRIFIVEKLGLIRILRGGQLLGTPFLDIRDRVRSTSSEQGLLGLAFPPNYAETGHFFVNYTDANGDTRIARFATDSDMPDTASPDSEFQVLQIGQPARNHNGGMLAFGPDGYLYIGTGDGGASFDSFGNGQNPATLLGKMLRIDVTSDPSAPYLIPSDNPWVDADLGGVDVRDELWAIGLRNPWRYSFDRGTGDLWIADVGQNQYEEVNWAPGGSSGGLNYGWPIQEGTHCVQSGDSCDSSGLVQPILEYDHAGQCSVTGGYVYRGSQLPALYGVYLYGDYCSGVIWAAAPDPSGGWRNELILRAGARISSFGEDEAGELYLTDLDGGTVYRIALVK